MRTHYDVLGVSVEAPPEEIKAAYKRLAVKYHPDKNMGDKDAEEAFKEINNAYQILSDPYQKAQYDFLINFPATSSETHTQAPHYYTSYQNTEPESEPEVEPTYYYRRKKPQTTTTRRYSQQKEEQIALLFIVGFLLLVGAGVLIGGAVSSYQERKAQEALYQEKLAIFGEAIAQYQERDYAATLTILDRIGQEKPQRREEAAVFKQEVLAALRLAAQNTYQEKQYVQALAHFNLLMQYETVYNQSDYFKIAHCQRNTGAYREALATLNTILTHDVRSIVAYTVVGDILCENLVECQEALTFLDLACQITIQDYQQTHGKAFAMLVPPSSVPDSHFELYYTRAKTFFALGKHKKAIEDLNWATFLRSDNAAAFLLQGDALWAARSSEKACKAWQQAQAFGAADAQERLAQRCAKQ